MQLKGFQCLALHCSVFKPGRLDRLMLPDLQDHPIIPLRAWQGTCNILPECHNKPPLALLPFWGNWAAQQLGDLGRYHPGDAKVASSQNEGQQEEAVQNLTSPPL